MIGLTLEFFPTLRDVYGRFARMEGATLAQRTDELSMGMRQLVAMVRSEAPKRTGVTASLIGYRIRSAPKRMTGELIAPSPITEFITRGTRPHIIRAHGGALRFPWAKGPQGAGTYFFKQVRHPGTTANPFIDRAVQIWLPAANESLLRMANSFAAFVTQTVPS